MKRSWVISVIVCFAILLVSCSAGESKTTAEDYNAAVVSFNDSLMESAVLLSNMAKFENNYWSSLIKVGGTVDYDKIVSGAYEWLEEKADVNKETVEQGYDDICTQYKAIIAMDVEGGANERVSEKVDTLFEVYNSLYLLVTSPSGGNSSFVDQYNELTDEIVNTNSLLSTLLSE